MHTFLCSANALVASIIGTKHAKDEKEDTEDHNITENTSINNKRRASKNEDEIRYHAGNSCIEPEPSKRARIEKSKENDNGNQVEDDEDYQTTQS